MIESSEIMGSLALVGMKVVLSSGQEMDGDGVRNFPTITIGSIEAVEAEQVA